MNLTKGKIASIIIFTINTFFYVLLNGNPYDVPIMEVDLWTWITALTIGWFGIILTVIIISYIIDEQDKKISNNL